jgi:hypothetical protein
VDPAELLELFAGLAEDAEAEGIELGSSIVIGTPDRRLRNYFPS